MKIDFTQFKKPLDALSLSDWQPSSEISAEEAKLAGLDIETLDQEFRLKATEVDLQITSDHAIVSDATNELVADIRSNQSLRSIRVVSASIPPADFIAAAKPIIASLQLHCFEDLEDTDNDADSDHVEPTKIDALAKLTQWGDNPSEELPSFLAQSDPNPSPGIWFFRLVAHPVPENKSLFVFSIQVFWRDAEFDEQQDDKTFWERADAFINLANDQAADHPISRVAKSLLFSAARFNAFDHWTYFDNAEEFSESKADAIESCVEEFRQMLIENFDDHLERFSRTED